MASQIIEKLPIDRKAVLSIDEAAEYMNMGRGRIKELAHQDPSFPATREGAVIRINRKGLDEWLLSRARRRVGFPQFAINSRV